MCSKSLLGYAFLLPAFVLAFGSAVAAQGDKFRKPKQDAGLGMNVPSGNRYSKIRAEASIDFRNESLPRTAGRVQRGSPQFSLTATGSRIRTAPDDSGTVHVVLHEQDGANRVALQLPKGFLGGVLVVKPDGGGGIVLPILLEGFQIDVPLFLRAARATGSKTLSLTFYAIRNSMLELIRVEAIADQDQRTVSLRY